MIRLISNYSILFCLCSVAVSAAEFGAVSDPYTGIWSGSLTVDGQLSEVHAHVVRYQREYEVALRAKPDSRLDATAIFRIQSDSLTPVDVSKVSMLQVEDDRMSGQLTGGTFSLRQVPFTPSDTLGRQAPSGAVVLYDGSGLDAWKSVGDERDMAWKPVEGGAIEVFGKNLGKKHKQDIRTKALFGDYELHVEFKLPDMPDQVGQKRSNSGIFHFGAYETQILDSFGLHGKKKITRRGGSTRFANRTRTPSTRQSYGRLMT